MRALCEGDHVTLEVVHRTRFQYSRAVALSHNELRMSPVDTGLQKVLQHSISLQPDVEIFSHRDHFGNLVHHFNILEPHDALEIIARSRVQTTNAVSCGPESSPDPRPYDQRLVEYLCWSPGIPPLAEYESVPPGQKIDMAMDEIEFGHCLYELGHYFFKTFRYDPDVTHVHSSPKDLFLHGGGVCQDMAHAMIGVLRNAGIPARYVSGYIFDPAGEEIGEHLRGSAATHAWVQAWHDGHGWIGIDPTNDKLVDWQYVRTALGRDYFDVQPLRGLFSGQTEQQLDVSVHVSIVTAPE
ncbi:transglutaminase family protein [Mariprofundus erugo]|uniref:Transglutaminase family protein n=1 Tax=Mariprofundus erugo TaxID=2528639 RepID=A0A5R9GMD9_9PROT|nr:transglutaminase family protein [Mariprofundus erugo]TLS66265.1 transglutaminase family protein [Mariprofundus erugo]